jgi:hypothetical protein
MKTYRTSRPEVSLTLALKEMEEAGFTPRFE